MITFKCRRCMQLLTARADQIGQTIGCVSCGTKATVPEPQPPKMERLPEFTDEIASTARIGAEGQAGAERRARETDDGTPLPELADDFYFDEDEHTPRAMSRWGTASISCAVASGLVAIATGSGNPAHAMNLDDAAAQLAVLFVFAIKVAAVIFGLIAVALGLRGMAVEPRHKVLGGVGAALGLAAFAVAFVFAVQFLFP